MTAIELMLDHYDIHYRDRSGEQPIRCPVHDDRNASASLNTDKEVFNCHACGASGDVYTMVMKREDLDFASAKDFVAKVTGVQYNRSEDRVREPVKPGTGYRPRYRRKGRVARHSWT